MKHFESTLLNCELVARDTYELTLISELAKKPSLPGQFVHIQVPDAGQMLLRRPISLNSVDRAAGTYTLIIQAKGEGTRRLCDAQPGARLDTLGALGRGFVLPKGARRVALVGGGIGVAPLRYCMEKWPLVQWDAFFGFRGQEYAYQLERYEKLASHLYLASDDGTLGEKGFVTDLLRRNLIKQPYDAVLACGPLPMFRALARVMDGFPEVPCFISMEQRMGCGVGACRVCVCKTQDAEGEHFRRVCQDGPVFPLTEVKL